MLDSLTVAFGIALFVSGVVHPMGFLYADDQPKSGSAASKLEEKNAGETKASSSEKSAKLIYLPGPDGKLVPVPQDATLEEFLEWRKKRTQHAKENLPGSSVTSIDLEGRTDGDRTTLIAKVRVQIHNENTPVKVPLGLGEAVLRDFSYKGDGEARFDGFKRETGYRWWFRGKGLHELTLTMLVPIQKQTPIRRIQLTMPVTAVSHLKLQVPMQRISVKGPEHSAIQTKTVGQTATEINVYGLGTRLDLQWQPLPNQKKAETVLQSDTSITIGVVGESVLLEAKQTVQTLQGSFSELSVHLPAGFELLTIDENSGKKYSGHEVDSSDPNHVTLKFSEPTTGPVELNWILESKLSMQGGSLILDGFEVDRARQQTGEIAIRKLDGFRITNRENETRFAHRTDVSDLAGNGSFATAFRFLKQPFRLVLDFQEIEPYFTVESSQRLRFAPDFVDLDVAFAFRVYRGVVQKITLYWPNCDSQGWTFEPIRSPGLIEKVEVEKDADGTTFRVQLVDRKSGRFSILLKARRTASRDEARSIVSLPIANASSRLPAVLVVIDNDNVETEILPEMGTLIRPLPAHIKDTLTIPKDLQELRRLAYQIESDQPKFSAKATVHEQTIRTTTSVTSEIKDQNLQVTQHIEYDVQYERVPQVRVMVPADMEDKIQFADQDGAILTPNWTGLEVGNAKQARLVLSKSRIGQFAITARFNYKMPEIFSPGKDVEIDLPVVQSSDAEFSSVRLALNQSGRIDVSLTDNAWKQQLSLSDAVVWKVDEARSSIPMQFHYSVDDPSQTYSVRKALIQTVFDHEGNNRSRARYQIDSAGPRITLLFPSELVPDAFWWNGQKLDQREMITSDLGVRRVVLDVADDSTLETNSTLETRGLLSVDFHSKLPSPLEWTAASTLRAPKFPPTVWTNETVWEIILPYNQHLLNIPGDFSPQFRWTRDSLFWRRKPTNAYADVNHWINPSGISSPEADGFPEGKSYRFSQFGSTGSISFSSMSQSLVVLSGAGVALALGVLLMKIPVTRSVLTLLFAAFALSVAGLWYAAPIQLFLQPAIFGVVLAVAAVLIDDTLKRKRTSTTLTLSSPSDFLPSNAAMSSVEHPFVVGVGSEDLTALRPASIHPPEPAQSTNVSTNE